MDGAQPVSTDVYDDEGQKALAVLRALDAPFAVIEFTQDGEVLWANENFLTAMEFEHLSEIQGHHHRQFLFPEDAESPDYSTFWKRLAGGNFMSSEVRRRKKSGAEIWLSANYVPIRSAGGRIERVRKYAIDVTERHDAVDALLIAIRKLADGDILVRLDERVRGDFRYVRDEFNALMDGLEKRMRKTMGCTDAIRDVFDVMSSTSLDLQEKAKNQSEEVERTVASIGEISKRTVENSQAAEVANGLVRETEEKAKNGAQIVHETVEATQRITDITSEVAKITKVIESFAFQTNLLSINAAVEAARAGEAGRGFAVVAGEVRNLAQRSAEASKDIANLTRQSEAEVERGAELARSAGKALEDIGNGVGELSQSVTRISAASQQQATSVSEIESAMRTFEGTVKDVSRLANSGRESADALANELASLQEQTNHFSTRDGPGEPCPDPRNDRRKSGRSELLGQKHGA